jgi:hypothetical protein
VGRGLITLIRLDPIYALAYRLEPAIAGHDEAIRMNSKFAATYLDRGNS